MNSITKSNKRDFLQIGLGLIVGAVLFIFLYVKSHNTDPQLHGKIVAEISEIKHADAEFQKALILNRYGLVSSYDQLVESNQNFLKKSEIFEQLLHSSMQSVQLSRNMAAFRQLLSEQKEFLEDFKSHNAVLKNSLRYLPQSIDNFTKTLDSNKQRQVIEKLHDLVRKVLQVNLIFDGKLLSEIDNQVADLQIDSMSLKDDQREQLALILRHAKLIEKYKVNVDVLVEKTLSIPTETALNEVFNTYLELYQTRENNAHNYRTATVVVAALLVLVVLYYMVKITRLSSALQQTVYQLKFQKFALDQHAIVSITDSEGNITYANQRFCDVSKFSYSELIGQNHRIVNHADMPKTVFSDLWSTITKGNVWRGDIKNKAKDGSEYWVASTIVPFLDENKKPFQYVSIRTDITKRKMMEAEVIQANRAKSDFLANMSHEIRTPMNAIIGLSHLALKTNLNEKQSDYLEKILSSASALLTILNDILDFSKIEAGKLTMEHTQFSLQDLINQVFALNCLKADEKGLEVMFHQAADVPNILVGDQVRLGQILSNLLSNAIKFTEHGEVVVSIGLESETANQMVLKFVVKDSGIGLTSDQQAKLFESFSQADTSTTRKYGGTGLGLAISKKLVEAMHGSIGVKSSLGLGSEFSFTARFGKAGSKDFLNLPYNKLFGKRALIADDAESARNILSDMLSGFGMQVKAVSSGEIALAELATTGKRDLYDFAIIDWQMPGMSGLKTILQIKQADFPQVKPHCLLVTGYGREEVYEEVSSGELDDVIIVTKPVVPNDLLNHLLALMGDNGTAIASPRNIARDVDDIQRLLGMRVLLVEDNAINRQVATEILESHGIEVAIAENGQTALEILAREEIDLVLLDIEMPVLNGFETIKKIRANTKWLHLPVIAMTAHAQESMREKCLVAGMNDHIAKPFDHDILFSVLARWAPQKAQYWPKRKLRKSIDSDDDCPALKGLDTCAGLKSVRGNKNLYRSLLIQFTKSYSDLSETLQRALKDNDKSLAKRYLHTVRSVAGAIGATGLAEKAWSYEQCIGERNGETCESEKLSFDNELQDVLNSISGIAEDDVSTLTQSEHDSSNIEYHTLINDLERLLKTADLEVSERISALRPFLTTNLQKTSFRSLQKAIETFDFDEALQHLYSITSDTQHSGGSKNE